MSPTRRTLPEALPEVLPVHPPRRSWLGCSLLLLAAGGLFLTGTLFLGLLLGLAARARASAWSLPEAPTYRERDDTIQQSTDSFESGGKTIPVERFEPRGDGKYPVVLVIHGADGLQFDVWHKVYRGTAQELARHGYVVLLPHYFERTGSKFGDDKTNKQHFVTWMGTVEDAIDQARKQPNVDPDRLGLVGVSLGSYLSLSVASQDKRVGAVVEFFGGLPQPVADHLEHLPPTLILHGDADPLVPLAEGRKLERLLQDHKIPFESKIYSGQGHGFTGADARDALNRTVTFLDKHLKDDRANPPGK